jgi:hypothetical protein
MLAAARQPILPLPEAHVPINENPASFPGLMRPKKWVIAGDQHRTIIVDHVTVHEPHDRADGQDIKEGVRTQKMATTTGATRERLPVSLTRVMAQPVKVSG